MVQQHPSLTRLDLPVLNSFHRASQSRKERVSSYADPSSFGGDNEEEEVIGLNLFSHRKRTLRLFLLQSLHLIFVQSRFTNDDLPSKNYLAHNLEKLICVFEHALSESSFANSKLFVPEVPPIIPLSDTLFSVDCSVQVILRFPLFFFFWLMFVFRRPYLRFPQYCCTWWKRNSQ